MLRGGINGHIVISIECTASNCVYWTFTKAILIIPSLVCLISIYFLHNSKMALSCICMVHSNQQLCRFHAAH